MVEGAVEPCWCTRLPVLPVEALAATQGDGKTMRCYCPACLQELVDLHGLPTPQGNEDWHHS
jgi:hypothetical protein